VPNLPTVPRLVKVRGSPAATRCRDVTLGSGVVRSFSPNPGVPVDEGTEVVESWRIIREDDRISALSDEEVKGLLSMTVTGIETTLANLKKIAEA
jgi:hypothetical protein